MTRWRRRGMLAFTVLATAGLAAAADAPRVSDAWARATPPGATVGAVYLRIEGGSTADRLLGATSPRAKRVELHAVDTSSGMSRMRPAEGVDIPPGARVELAPHGLHLMLLGLESSLRAGESLPLLLRFERGGEAAIEVEVRSATAGDGSGAHH
jgi:periplasmic copper chaperone A